MELLYAQEHLSCLHYDKTDKPAIEVREIAKGYPFDEQSPQCRIVFLLEGCLECSRGNAIEAQPAAGQVLLLPPDKRFRLAAPDRAKVLIIRLGEAIRFCECYLAENLRQEGGLLNQHIGKEGHSRFLLDMNSLLQGYTQGLAVCVEKGLRCKYYFEAKTRELFYLFRAFYCKQELALFFRDMLHSDAYFYYFVERNHRNYRTVAGLAAAMNMTVRTFEKHFKAVFSMPAYKWMTQRKAGDIYNALRAGQVPLKELASQFGFASKSSFSDFCKKNLGKTPGQVRENLHPDGNDEQKQQNA